MNKGVIYFLVLFLLIVLSGFTFAKGGFDEFGYNYQAHIFNGRYCDYDRVLGGDLCDVNLIMKWNDAFLTTDREVPMDYMGTGAWLTNHMKGDNWSLFIKIVAVPEGSYKENGVWYTDDGEEIGPEMFEGALAKVQEVESGVGATYISPAAPGLGKY